MNYVVDNLKEFVKNKTVKYENSGLCLNCGSFDWLGDEIPFYEYWKHFSGNHHYPVPSTDKTLTAEQFYLKRQNFYVGEQLELRLDLAKHIIKCYEDEQNENGSSI